MLEFDKCFGENIIRKGRMAYYDLNRGVRIGLVEGLIKLALWSSGV